MEIRRRFVRKEDALKFEAETKMSRLLDHDGTKALGTRITIDEFGDLWWDRTEAKLAATTRRNYEGALKRYILPKLGATTLSALTVPRVNRFKNDLIIDGRGASTVRYAMAVLSALCSEAVLDGYIDVNPCRGVKQPAAPSKSAIRALAPLTIEAIRSQLSDEADRLLVSLIAYAGLRPGEALALKWSDIGKAVLVIDKALALGEMKATKTERNRSVDILQPLRNDLASFKASLPATPGPGSLLFPHPDDPAKGWGDTTYRNWRSRKFDPAAKAAGARDATPYYLRHSFVSLLLSAGMRRGEVAEQAGHSLAVMESTYAHVMAEFRGVEMNDPAAAIDQARVAIVWQRAKIDLHEATETSANSLQIPGFPTKPTRRLELRTPSLRVKCSTN